MPEVEIESGDLTERLVGITPIYLNQFIQRGMYGIRASVRAGSLREQRRKFSKDDVFGIALVWLLFESGLRSDPIHRILNDLGKTKTADANRTAQALLRSGAEYLVIIRHPRRPREPLKKPEQRVVTCAQSKLGELVAKNADASITAIPVGSKFADIQKRLEIFY